MEPILRNVLNELYKHNLTVLEIVIDESSFVSFMADLDRQGFTIPRMGELGDYHLTYFTAGGPVVIKTNNKVRIKSIKLQLEILQEELESLENRKK